MKSAAAPISVDGFVLVASGNDLNTSDTFQGPVVQPITDLKLEVVGCISGNHMAPAKSAELRLYIRDRQCRILLHSFRISGILYQGMLEGEVGTSAVFKSAFDSKDVVITQMIHSPILKTDSISYSVGDGLAAGRTKNVLSFKRGPNRRLRSSGLPPGTPNFRLENAHLLTAIPASKSFGLSFDLECEYSMKEDDHSQKLKCGPTDLKDISYILVRDDFNNHPTERIADALFKGGALHVNPALDYVAPTKSHHGGFRTARQDIVLSSPSDTAKNPNMILILKNRAGFQYFNIDMDTGR